MYVISQRLVLFENTFTNDEKKCTSPRSDCSEGMDDWRSTALMGGCPTGAERGTFISIALTLFECGSMLTIFREFDRYNTWHDWWASNPNKSAEDGSSLTISMIYFRRRSYYDASIPSLS